jgi:hypothetical protein
VAPTRTPLRPSAIDSFCPRFKDLLGGKSGFVEGHYYMNQAMRGSDMQDLEPSVNDSEQEPLRQLVGVAFREAKAGLREQIPEAAAKTAAHLQSVRTHLFATGMSCIYIPGISFSNPVFGQGSSDCSSDCSSDRPSDRPSVGVPYRGPVR